MEDESQSHVLRGKAAVVTGASSGIGKAVAAALSSRGVNVTLCARRETALEGVARGLDGETQICVADFSVEEEVVRAIASANERWARLDILVNAAGIARVSPLHEGAVADWRDMWEINVLGLAMANREALRYFPVEGGHIVNLGSMSGHRVPAGGFYAATKFAVRAMTEGLRQELRKAGNSTRVSSLSPGFVDTPLVDEYFSTAGTTRAEAIDYAMLRPEEVAATVLHLLEQPDTVEITDVLMRPRDQAT